MKKMIYFLRMFIVLVLFSNFNTVTGQPTPEVVKWSFPTEDVFNMWTNIDVNGNDGKNPPAGAWSWSSDGAAMYRYHSTKPGDDWLISPSINLEQGWVYRVDVEWCAPYGYEEKCAIHYGQGITINAQKDNEISDYAFIYPTSTMEQTGNFAITSTGSYNIGLYCHSNADMNILKVTSVKVVKVGAVVTPTITAMPTSLDFGNIVQSTSSTPKTITISGHMTDDISYSLSGMGSETFVITETQWTAATGGELSIVFTPTAAQSYEATLTLSSAGAENVVVQLTGIGGYSVTITPPENGTLVVKNGGIVIASGTAIASGTELTVEAIPADGYALGSITVNGVAIAGSTVIVTEDITIAATFTLLPTHSVTITPPENGTLAVNNGTTTITSGDEIVEGTELTVEAISADGYALGSITVNGVAIAGSTVIITEDITIAATFTLLPTHSVTITPPENGTLAVNNGTTTITSGDEIVEGTELIVEATPADGYALGNITVNGFVIVGSTVIVTEDIAITATFILLPPPTIEVAKWTFKSQEEFNRWTVIDEGSNNYVEEGKLTFGTWWWNNYEDLQGGEVAQYQYLEQAVGDDWLISPNITLERGKTYRVNIELKIAKWDYEESLGVYYGQGVTAANQTIQIADYSITYTDKLFHIEETADFLITADGVYNIGLYCYSKPNQNHINIKSVTIIEVGESAAMPTITATPTSLDFGNIVQGASSASKTVAVHGDNLTGDISYTLSGTGSDAFVITETQWTAAAGGELSVVFTPIALQNYEATLTLESDDAEDIVVQLAGIGDAITPVTHTITITIPTNGTLVVKSGGKTITTGASIAKDTELTVEAIPVTGYALNSITVNGVTITGTTIIVTEDITIAATFELIPTPTYIVTITTPINGTLIVKNAGEAITSGDAIAEGIELAVEATPATGYVLGAITVDGIPIKGTAVKVVKDITIGAAFSTVGVDSLSDLALKITSYGKEITVTSADVNRSVNIDVIDMVGRIVNQSSMNGLTHTITMDKSGIYVVRISFGGIVTTEKVIIK